MGTFQFFNHRPMGLEEVLVSFDRYSYVKLLLITVTKLGIVDTKLTSVPPCGEGAGIIIPLQ